MQIPSGEIIAQTLSISGDVRETRFHRLDAVGNVLSDFPLVDKHDAVANSGGIVCTAANSNNMSISMYDWAGNELWVYALDNGDLIDLYISQYQTGTVYVGGKISNSHEKTIRTVLMKFSESGALLWETTISPALRPLLWDMKLVDQGVLLTGTGTSNPDAIACAIEHNGCILWERTFTCQGESVLCRNILVSSFSYEVYGLIPDDKKEDTFFRLTLDERGNMLEDNYSRLEAGSSFGVIQFRNDKLSYGTLYLSDEPYRPIKTQLSFSDSLDAKDRIQCE